MKQGKREPIFNVPGVVGVLVGVLAAVHGVRSLLGPAADDAVLAVTAFIPARFASDGGPMPGGVWAGPLSFVSHAFLHADLLHLLINSAWLLAVGSPIARRMPPISFISFFALCAAGGALLFLALNSGLNSALIGASGAVSGLMAATLRLLYAAEDPRGRWLLAERPHEAARLSVGSMLTRRAPLTAIIGWVVINFVMAFAMGSIGDGNPIAWEAHLGGFFVGLLAFDLFDRGNPHEQVRGASVLH